MGKRPSSNVFSPPQPRSVLPLPGYPSLAAAGLYLCLSGGCADNPQSNLAGDLAPPFADAGTSAADGPADVTPPENLPNPAGKEALPFDAAPVSGAADADIADALPVPPSSDTMPDRTPDLTQPNLAGGVAAPFDGGSQNDDLP